MGQYISKDALAAEIKRLIKHSEMVADHNTQITELVSRELDALYHLISFLDTLEEPANEDLEEAAYKASLNNFVDPECLDDDELRNFDWIKYYEQVFKTGAQWQKQHLMKDAVDGSVCAQRTNGAVIVRTNFIRAGLALMEKVKLIIIKE